jgi:hypothetical protein
MGSVRWSKKLKLKLLLAEITEKSMSTSYAADHKASMRLRLARVMLGIMS